MRSTLRTCGILLSCSFLALFLACGGGGSNSPSNKLNVQDPPVATAPAALPADAPLVEYKTYTFSTTASDADIGVTIAKCVWNFGDGTAPVTASAAPFSVQHAFASVGTGNFTVSVTPTDSRGIAGNPSSSLFSVTAAPNPFVVNINQPSSAVTQSVAVGSTVSLTFDFTVSLASANNAFTYTASGLSFLTNDTTDDTIGALTQVAANEWQATVVFPATAASGTRTFTPTIQVTDTTGQVSSGLVSFPTVTIQTLPATAPPPTVTLAAAPAILVAGTTNTTYQNVPITFTATAVDTVVPTMVYSWSFGDGGKGDVTGSTALSMAHTYANPGVYTVVFTADTGIPGAIRSTTMAVQILPDLAPSISFTALPSPYYVGMPITFTATDTVAGQTPTYTWNFGDGSTGTGSPIVHAFMSYVPATVSLTANDGKGGVTTTTQSLNILADVPPVAGAVTGPTGNLYESKAYSFTATATQPAGGNPVTSFIWNWGDGSVAQTDSTHVTALSASSFTDLLTHSFPAGNAATYSVTVQPVDSFGSVGAPSPATVFTVVPTLLPTPAFTAPATASTFTLPVGSPVTVTFTLSVSNPNGTPGTFLPASALTVYPLGAGNPAVASSVTANGDGTYNATYSYPAGSAPGTAVYTPAAQAVDAQNIVGPVVTGQTVTIKTVAAILPPVVTMTATPAILAGPSTTYQGVPVQFTATATDPNGDVLNYSWTFSDGGKGDVAATTAASALNQTHAFAAPGIYQVVFTATNTLPGGTNSVTKTIQVLADTAPSISVVVAPASNYYVGAPVTFTVTDATPNQAPTYTWNFGDGSPAVTGSAPTHTFQAAGNTVVTLVADDGKGGVANWTKTLAINADTAPVAQAVAGPSGNLYQSKVYTFTATATELVSGNTVASFIWNWGDGSSTQVDASHIVAGAGGVYTDTLTHAFPAGQAAFSANITVTPVDNHGAVGSASPNTSFPVVATALPVGTFLTPAAPTNSSVGEGNNLTVTFTFSTTNPNGAPGALLPGSAFAFYPLGIGVPGTTAVVTSLGGGSYQASYTYTGAATPGTAVFTPAVRVTDALSIVGPVVNGQTVTITTVAAINPPIITLAATPAIAAGTDATYQGVPVQFTATAVDPNGDILNYSWNFGDGNIISPTTAAAALAQSHAFATPGIYTVTFTANNTLPNGSNTVSVNIQVLADTKPSLTVTLNPSSNFFVGEPISFNVADSVAGQVPVYTWNFGDGSPIVTGATASHTYQASGNAVLTLTADDGKGGVTLYTNTLTIQADIVPVAQAVTGPAGNLFQSRAYTFNATATELVSGNSIASFIWNWGDGTTSTDSSPVNAGAGIYTSSLTHSFAAGQPAFTANITVQPVDNHGAIGVPSPNTAFPVVATSFPTPQFTAPATPSNLTLPVGSQVAVTFTLAVSNPNGAPGTWLPASGVTVYPLGIGTPGTTAVVTANGDGTYNATYDYSAAAVPGTAIFTPAARATDGLSIVGPVVSGQPVNIVTVAAINPPVVAMTATPAIVAGVNATYQGVPVNFAATATDPNGDILYYAWNFGDGSTVAQTGSAAALNQTHAFAAPGIYTVVFTATNTLPGGTNTVSVNIQVLADTKPNLTVAINPASGYYTGVPVAFSVTDSVANQTPTYTWNFGDGTPAATGAAQTHTFLAAGNTVVTLTADDGKGGVTTFTTTLAIQADVPPVAQAVTGPAGNLYQSKSYTFIATAKQLTGGNAVASFAWNWGDGTTSTDSSPANSGGGVFTSTMTHVFAAGQPAFNANITVVPTDIHGAVGVPSPNTSFPVVVTALPTGTFLTPAAPTNSSVGTTENVTVTFTFSTTNPNGAPGAFLPGSAFAFYPLGIGTPGTTAAVTSLGGGSYQASYTYTGAATPGTAVFTPAVRVTDALSIVGPVVNGQTVTITTVAAINPPIITLVATPAIVAGTDATYQGVPVQFAATAVDPNGDILNYSWTFSDSGKGDVSSTTAASALNQTHAFAAPGIYTVTFTANNTLPNGSNSVSVNIQVLADTAPALTVTLTPSSNFFVGEPITFNVADSTPNQVPVYTWNFGDGSPIVTGATASHTFQASGQTVVTLTADDGKGGVTLYTNTLVLQADTVPVAQAVTGPAGNLFQSKSYTFSATATDLVPTNSVASFIWNWGDGTTSTDSSPAGPVAGVYTSTMSHSFPAGQPAFTANVTVQPVDNHGAVGVSSPNTAFPVVVTSFPTPSFTVPASASTLTLPVGSQVTVNFVLAVSNPNGAPGVFLPASGVKVYPLGIGTPGTTASVTANGDGTYNASYSYLAGAGPGTATFIPVAQATDASGIVGPVVPGQAVTVVTVAAINPPVVTMTATPAIVAGANTTYQGVPIQFAATASDPNGDILYYSWNFGDGSTVSQTTSAAALSQTHSYTNPGIYTVTFSATNTLPGGTNAVTFNIQVLADTKPALTVTLNPAANFFVAAPISFSVVDTTPNQTPIYTWNFGDGSAPVTGAAQVHTFLASGKVVVTLTADDQKGGVTTVTQTLTIQANIVPVAQAVQGPAGNLFQSKTYTFTATAQELVPTNSVTSFIWIWGDGTPNTVDNAPTGPVGNLYTSTMTHVFPAGQASFNANITVVPVDNHNAVGVTSPSTSFPVVNTSLPVVTFLAPAAPVSLNVDLNGTVTQTLTFTVSNPQAGVGATDPLPVAGIHFLANDGSGLVSVAPISSLGGGQYSVVVTYTGAAVTGNRTSTPTAYAVDSLGIQGLVATAPTITIHTQPANHAPSITVTSPASPTASVFTSDTVSITFTLTDADNDPVSYTVNWQDGTTPDTGTTTGNTVTGVPVTLTHVFADAFAAVTNPNVAAASITATDNRSTNSLATPKTVTYTVTYNAYPTAVITSPQASATIPAAVAALNIPNTDPPVVVLPNNGKVTFLGTTTNPGSAATIPADAGLTYVWSFPGGVPSSSAQASPGEVTFSGTPGQVTAYLVSFTVLDTFQRSSANATGVNPNTFKRWVIVDGTDSQTFYLSFLYRQRSGTSSPDTYTYATLASHGYGDTVTIYQDGLSNTYTVANTNAPTTIPVRSDVPFWLTVPGSITGDTADGTNYQVNIPNKHGVDPDLEGPGLARTLTVSEGTAFAFQNWGATAPFNPQLQITTGSGFGTENNGADQRRFQGNTTILNNECYATGTLVLEANLRWLDRLSVPTTDALPVLTEWIQSPNLVTGFSGLKGYQLIPEWFVFVKTTETRDFNSLASTTPISGFHSATAPTDMGFVIDPSYDADNASSYHLAVSAIQAYRAPASTLDPYDFDVMRANLTSPAGSTALNDGVTPEDDSLGLNTTPVATAPLAFMNGLVNSAPSGPLAGGLNAVHVIYDANDVNRVPDASVTYDPFHNRASFSYAEYLWTKVWARPLVVNRTNLSYYDTEVGFSTYPKAQVAPLECFASGAATTTETIDTPWFFYSNPTHAWPYAYGVSPTNSAYNLNVANGGTFDASSPVVEPYTGTAPSSTGVGRFYWTAFEPHFNADSGALISRTWLADGTTAQIPTTFTGSVTGDANTAWGLLPPQDTMIDKRSRNLDGTANNGTLGGYRVTWFNPTRDASGNVVPPDFWAIQVISDTKTYLYLVSSNYPRTTQLVTSPLMTDARTYLNIDGTTSASYVSGDLAGPGYCWFDIPPEVRPAAGTATVTVFGLKSILKNHAILGARSIDRIEWVEAVKTVTANISTKPGGIDQSFAHKIPFNYAWDIVVVNGASTPVAP